MLTGTIGDRIRTTSHTRGFDYLRIFLALCIVGWHSIYVSGNEGVLQFVLHSWLGPFKALVLPMFFTLSGFLVAGSMERSRTLEGFATLRVLRIVPALAVEILLSVFLLGTVVTTLPLKDYFGDPKTRLYLLNVFGDVHYLLPGVFSNNPRPNTVNLSLWTVPYELMCYVMLMVLAAVGFFRRRKLFATTVLSLNLALWAYYFITKPDGPGTSSVMTLPGLALVIAFLAGNMIYLYRDRIPLRRWLAGMAVLLSFALLAEHRLMVLAVIPAAYLTVWLGLTSPPRMPILMSGDYSYGVYLFAFPIQQVLATTSTFRPLHANLPAAMLLSLLYAAFSWHCIEKRVLSQKRAAVEFVESIGRIGRKYAGAAFGFVRLE